MLYDVSQGEYYVGECEKLLQKSPLRKNSTLKTCLNLVTNRKLYDVAFLGH